MKILNDAVNFNGLPTYTSTVDFYSEPIELESIFGFCVSTSWSITGSPTNCFVTLEGTVDGVNWEEEPLARVIINTDGEQMWNVFEVFYKAMRVKYALDSGTGAITASAHINAKGW